MALNSLPHMIDDIREGLSSVENFVSYIKARIMEPSTWAGIVGGFGGANNLHHPWDYAAAVIGAIMVLLPTSKKSS